MTTNERAEISPVLDAFLNLLITTVNPELLPSDKGRTIELFKWMRDNWGRYTADDVERWFIKNRPSWVPDLSERFLAIARSVLARKRITVGDKGHKGRYWDWRYLEELKRKAGGV